MYLRNVILVALAVAVASFAQDPTSAAVDAPYQVSFAANLNIAETYIDIGNDGALVVLPSVGTLGFQSGSFCVNVYAFDQNEEMIACCACYVTPDQTVHLGAIADLTSNTVTSVPVNSITVKLVETMSPQQSSTDCTNSAGLISPIGLPAGTTEAYIPATGGLLAWRTTPHVAASGSLYYTEVPFTPAFLLVGEMTNLANACANIIGRDSGKGICPSCHLGALGAQKM